MNSVITLRSTKLNSRSNVPTERSVQTVKKAIRAWNWSLRVSFYAFKQRVFFTHRNTSFVRGNYLSEVLLGRKMRLPAIPNYLMEGRGVFRAEPLTAPFLAMYVVLKDNITEWLTQECSDGVKEQF